MTTPDPKPGAATAYRDAAGRRRLLRGGVTGGGVTRGGVIRGGVIGGGAAVVVEAARLVVRHWPVLLVTFLVGHAVRNAVLWAAVLLSPHSHLLGALLVPLAPMSALVAMILMLRAVAGSLTNITLSSGRAPTSGAGGSATRGAAGVRGLVDDRLALLAGTIIPFLAVYAAQGYLAQDRQVWLTDANLDQLQNVANPWSGVRADVQVTTIADERMLWVLIGVAFAARWLLGRLRLTDRSTRWGLFAAWLEVTWVTLFAAKATHWLDLVWEWVTSRALVVWVQDLWHTVAGWFGPLTRPVEAVVSWLAGAVGGLDTTIIVPLAWLTVGAVVVGHTLVDRTPDPVTGRADERLRWLPYAVRRPLVRFLRSVTARFADLLGGLRLLRSAGLAPMLVFCVVFLAAAQLSWVVWAGVRWVTGPLAPELSFALMPVLEVLPRATYTVVAVCLIAAALDRLVGAGATTSANEPDVPATPGET